jgi:hypothetical protein
MGVSLVFEVEAPKIFEDILPAELRGYATYITGGVICFGLIVILLFLISMFRFMFRGKAKLEETKDFAEDLTEYPDLKSNSGDRQLRVEGVPARLRLAVIAPAGTASEVDVEELKELLDKIVAGLGDIYEYDKPRVKVWPTQLSYQGFGAHFHNCMQTGAEEGEQTRWVLIAGRVKVGKRQFMLGLALQTIKPNTIGRRTIDSHEWASVLRVRVKD